MPDLYPTPIEVLTFQDVQEFLAARHREHLRLEYKQDFSSKDRSKQVAKVASSFANTSGGMLIFGVGEDGDRRPAAEQAGMQLGNEPRAAVISACAHNVFPPLNPDVSEFLHSPADPSRGFLVVRVAPSEDVHTTDDGTGIYVRIADQSEPVRASIDQIERLLERRKRHVDLQALRRENLMTRLAQLLETDAKPGVCWLSVGPRINLEALASPRFLLSQAPSLSVHVDYMVSRRAFSGTGDILPMEDGIFRFRTQNGTTAASDVYGNVVTCDCLGQECPGGLGQSLCHQLEPRMVDAIGTPTHYVEGAQLFSLIMGGLTYAKNLYRQVGYVGLLEVRVRCTGICKVPLCFCQGHGEFWVLGAPILDDVIDGHIPALPEELDAEKVLTSLVERVAWPWGSMEEGHPVRMLDHAERAFYGVDTCPCKQQVKSKHRQRCLICRQSQREESV